jgi:hypothetical protein
MSTTYFFADKYFTAREIRKLRTLLKQLKRLETLILKGYTETDELINNTYKALNSMPTNGNQIKSV